MDFKPAKKLGFGMMRMPTVNPNNDADVDVEQVKAMVDHFISGGFTYFDTAWMYNGFASEGTAKRALVDRYPRERFTLADKLHSMFLESPEDRDKIFRAQMEKTGVGWFDYYLLHGVKAESLPKYEALDCFRWLLDKREQGLVRHAGFSFHESAELLDRILTEHPEMEFVQLQVNYLDWESEWIQSRACCEVCAKHDKPVIVMEPVKGGTLAKVPAEVEKLFKSADPEASVPSWAIRFAASLPNVMVVLSGMRNLEEIKDNTGFMADFKPLSEEEKALCFKAAELINSHIAVPCTGCSYCTEGCPMKIAIPQYFSMYNEDMREDLKEKGWTATFSTYARLSEKSGKPGDCIACGQCESVCPQHLRVIEHLKDVAAHYKG